MAATKTPADQWNESLGPYAPDVAGAKAIIAELEARGLLDRAQIITCDTVSIQLGPPPLKLPTSSEDKDDQKITQPSVEDLLMAASEGFQS